MRWAWLIGLAMLAGCSGVGAQQAAAGLEVGQTYAILWSCIGQVGCYGEVVRVDAPQRADGWIDVSTCRPKPDGQAECGEKWRVNLSQALAVRPFAINGRAAN